MPLPRSGDILYISRAASVQFGDPFLFRLIRVHDWATYDGWVWLDGYQLNAAGDAVERRTIFVKVNGLRLMKPPPAQRRPPSAPHASRRPAPPRRDRSRG